MLYLPISNPVPTIVYVCVPLASDGAKGRFQIRRAVLLSMEGYPYVAVPGLLRKQRRLHRGGVKLIVGFDPRRSRPDGKGQVERGQGLGSSDMAIRS